MFDNKWKSVTESPTRADILLSRGNYRLSQYYYNHIRNAEDDNIQHKALCDSVEVQDKNQQENRKMKNYKSIAERFRWQKPSEVKQLYLEDKMNCQEIWAKRVKTRGVWSGREQVVQSAEQMKSLRRVKYKKYYRDNQVQQQIVLYSVFLGEKEFKEVQGQRANQQQYYHKFLWEREQASGQSQKTKEE